MDCNANFKLGYLTIEGAPKSFDSTQRIISSNRAGAILFPWSTIAADWNDRIGTACRNLSMALFGVIRAVLTDAVNLFILRNLIQQIGENRPIANWVRGDFERPNVQRFGVDPDMQANVCILHRLGCLVPLAMISQATAVSRSLPKAQTPYLRVRFSSCPKPMPRARQRGKGDEARGAAQNRHAELIAAP